MPRAILQQRRQDFQRRGHTGAIVGAQDGRAIGAHHVVSHRRANAHTRLHAIQMSIDEHGLVAQSGEPRQNVAEGIPVDAASQSPQA